MSAALMFRLPSGEIARIGLEGDEAFLGRDPKAQVVLPFEQVSRQHARLVREGGTWCVEDLGSTNGTQVNGRSVVRARLRHLSVLTLADAQVLFVTDVARLTQVRRKGIVGVTLVPAGVGNPLPIDVPAGEATLGRASWCAIPVEDARVSKLHARLERTATELTVHDAGSVNGTLVNGTRVTSARLQDGDLLVLGHEASFRVAIEWGEITALTEAGSRPDDS